MPTLSVFFRKDDVDKWKSIENKSEWLHSHLSNSPIRVDATSINVASIPQPVLKQEAQVTKIPYNTIKLATAQASGNQLFVPEPPDPDTGYPCCQKAKPCKHWKFDELNSQWVNELTGKIKEAV